MSGKDAAANASKQASASELNAEILHSLAETVKLLQKEVSEQNKNYLKMSREAAATQTHYENLQAAQENRQERDRSRIIDLEDELAVVKGEKESLLARPAKFLKLQDPEYSSRFEVLMRMGTYSMDEVEKALDATMQDGKYSSQRADAYLKSLARSQHAEVLQRANAGADESLAPITETSALGRLLCTPGDADGIDIVAKLRDVHARSRARNTHSAIPAICAGNLLDAPSVKGDPAMGRKGTLFLSRVANAVSEDCSKCGALRQEAESTQKWKDSKVKAKTDAAAAPTPAKPREKQRLTLPFKPADSRRDVRKPRGVCADCKKGWEGGHYLYYCGECNRGFHLLCTTWKHIRRSTGGRTWFVCKECNDALDQAIERGDQTKSYIEVDEKVEHDLAPVHSEGAVPDSEEPAPSNSNPSLHQPAGTANLQLNAPGFATPVSSTRGAAAAPSALRFDQLQTPSSQGGNVEPEIPIQNSDAKPNVTVKDYVPWNKTPDDYVPKAGSVGDKRHHPECGYHRTAYQNWRRKNVAIRDSVKAKGSSLGPLVSALSVDMKLTIGRQFMKEPALSCFWPKPVMTGADLDEWAKSAPDFPWVNRIPDETLLALLDKRFGVKKPDLFLSKRFASDLPPLDANGDVNYHADEFNRFASEWQTELTELLKAGCDFADTDLKQTFLNAISGDKLIHNEAVRHNTTSYMALIAHLCDWVLLKEDAVATERNEKRTLMGLSGANIGGSANSGSHTNNTQGSKKEGTAGGGSGGGNVKASALLTQSATAEGKTEKLPSHIKLHPRNNEKVICRGCNNAWKRSSHVPCFKRCKYEEHPAYNKECRERDGRSYTPLTWRGFRTAYPDVAPPQAMLWWEDNEKKKQADDAQATKRTRDGDST